MSGTLLDTYVTSDGQQFGLYSLVCMVRSSPRFSRCPHFSMLFTGPSLISMLGFLNFLLLYIALYTRIFMHRHRSRGGRGGHGLSILETCHALFWWPQPTSCTRVADCCTWKGEGKELLLICHFPDNNEESYASSLKLIQVKLHLWLHPSIKPPPTNFWVLPILRYCYEHSINQQGRTTA